ncbi:hypothetical protein GCM10010965_01400 [Caldalkalibacillus thermarum]|uniref:hypothetical protein n=1 Tax=Caldalkalibacillus thermarum TaxID=296745 RepID=UPI00166836CF|nr:hypothetical protein [Caldalkalibacillus thermarum]GGK12111.1 hypothetical protein GCM10010965_01400 [Caldalkalibacillus thermarum]
MDEILIVLGLIAFTYLVNVPLGMWRASVRKFSLTWMVAVHASVPVIIALRIWLGISNWLIPVLIGAAVLAQWTGSKLYQQKYAMEQVKKVGEE